MIKRSLALAVALTLSACSADKSGDEHFTNAKQLIQKKQLNEGIIELKNAIKISPQNTKYRSELGKVYLQLGNGQGAAKEFEKALSLDKGNAGLLVLLAQSYNIYESNEDILDLDESIEEFANQEQKIHYLSYKVAAYIRGQQQDNAESTVAEMNAIAPSNNYAMIASAHLELAKGNVSEALNRLQKVLDINAELPEAVLLDALANELNGSFENAANQYKKYLELQPNAQVIYLKLANVLVKTDQYKEAEKYADSILTQFPKQPFATYIKAVVKFLDKDYVLASEFAESAISFNFNDPHLKLVAGISAFHLKKYELTTHHIDSILKYITPSHPARKMLAMSQFNLGLIDNLVRDIEGYSPSSEQDNQFISSLSMNLYSIGANQQARNLLANVSKDGSTAKDKAKQGFMQLLMNDPAANDSLNAALEKNSKLSEAKLALSYAELQSNNFEKAEQLVKDWMKGNTGNVAGHNMLAAIYIKQRKLSLAEQILLKSLEIKADNLYAFVELSKVYFHQNNIVQAKIYAKKAVVAFPERAQVLELYYDVNRDDESFNLVEGYYQDNKGSFDAIILMSNTLIKRNEIKQAYGLLSEVEKNIKTPKRIWQALLFTLEQLKKGAEYISTVELWKKSNPYHVEPILILANYRVKTNSRAEALDILNKALVSEHKDNMMIMLAKLQLLLDLNKVQDAKSFYRTFKNNSIDSETKNGVEGRIALLEKNYKSAIPLLRSFYNKYPSSQSIAYISMAYQGANEIDKAIMLLESHTKDYPKDLRAQNMFANLLLSTDRNKALATYETIVQKQPANIVVLNNLAWLNMDKGDINKAFEYSSKAIGYAPEVANVIDTHAVILLKKGDVIDAWRKSSKAYKLTNGQDVQIALNYAEVLIANQQNDEAEKVLLKIDATSGDISQRKNKLLKLILN